MQLAEPRLIRGQKGKQRGQCLVRQRNVGRQLRSRAQVLARPSQSTPGDLRIGSGRVPDGPHVDRARRIREQLEDRCDTAELVRCDGDVPGSRGDHVGG